jgi:hypothetical protein
MISNKILHTLIKTGNSDMAEMAEELLQAMTRIVELEREVAAHRQVSEVIENLIRKGKQVPIALAGWVRNMGDDEDVKMAKSRLNERLRNERLKDATPIRSKKRKRKLR